MHKAIIIEDEAHYVEALSRMLSDFFPEIEMIGTAPSVSEGKVLLDHLQPDIVFMDIELKDGNSFHLLRQLEKKNFQLIFTTAFNEYAIHAFKFSAIDYLFKPVNPFELKAAVERALERIGRKENPYYDIVLDNLNRSEADKKIVLRTFEEIHIVMVGDIVRCQADNSYTTFFLTSGETIMVSKGIKEYEETLLAYGFFKPHQSHLINLKHLRKVDKSEGGELVMSDHSKVPLASRKKQELYDLLKKL